MGTINSQIGIDAFPDRHRIFRGRCLPELAPIEGFEDTHENKFTEKFS